MPKLKMQYNKIKALVI